MADHSSLRPWRLIEIRGSARAKLGKALGKADGSRKPSEKPFRSSLLIAVVASRKKSKVPAWEQDATAAGVAHTLSLLLDEAGWGVFWRTGELTRTKPVRKVHKLKKNEELLGWLYVGGVREKYLDARGKRPVDPNEFLTIL
ncbi:hypothetical protein L3i23_25080 [Herbiconiux sp. L3-i23]|nr:hypothetical protein L3i23_25080 [Herbiconiux sp. L3-i23]